MLKKQQKTLFSESRKSAELKAQSHKYRLAKHNPEIAIREIAILCNVFFFFFDRERNS